MRSGDFGLLSGPFSSQDHHQPGPDLGELPRTNLCVCVELCSMRSLLSYPTDAVLLYCCCTAVLLFCWRLAARLPSGLYMYLSRAAMVVQQYALKNEMSVEAAKHFIIFNHQQRRTLPPLKVRM